MNMQDDVNISATSLKHDNPKDQRGHELFCVKPSTLKSLTSYHIGV
jgi:hypothetical protein